MHLLDKKLQWLFLLSVLFLTFIGLAFVHSAGSYWGSVHYEGSAPFVVKQSIYGILALGIGVFIMKSPFVGREKTWSLLYGLGIILLLLVLIPGIGVFRNGSRSWMMLGPLSFQPAEFMKIALIGKLASMVSKEKGYANVFRFSHIGIILFPAALIMLQPDLGSTVILLVASFLLLFLAGYSIRFFGMLFLAGAISFTFLILAAPYRLNRIKSYIDPWNDPLGTGFQSIQSLLAIAPGGLLGHGFGNSRQKYLYLPEPQNDFIFSIIAEEIGFVGSFFVISLFLLFLLSSIGIAVRCNNRFSFLLVTGMSILIIFQACLNIGVVTGVLPVTGVTLPFISYGGSSLVTAWMAAGVIWHFAHRIHG